MKQKKIGLIDVDGHNFPNLCLMKLSAYHKSRGDLVEWYSSERDMYDIVYMSKVFSEEYSPEISEPLNTKEVIKGGTGYAIKTQMVEKYMINLLILSYLRKLNISIPIIQFIRNIQDMENIKATDRLWIFNKRMSQRLWFLSCSTEGRKMYPEGCRFVRVLAWTRTYMLI